MSRSYARRSAATEWLDDIGMGDHSEAWSICHLFRSTADGKQWASKVVTLFDRDDNIKSCRVTDWTTNRNKAYTFLPAQASLASKWCQGQVNAGNLEDGSYGVVDAGRA